MPGKNIKKLAGRPIIAYSIEAALKSRLVKRVIVSTNDEKIAKVAKRYKAEIPFIRPARLATDRAKTLPVLIHAVKYLEKKEKTVFDIIVLLQPSTPFLTSGNIDEAIETLIKTKTKSCVSVCQISERPEWMYTLRGHRAKPFIKMKKQSQASQFLPRAYRLNGAVYAILRDTLMKEKRIFDNTNISAIIMSRERSYDIDYPIDLDIAQIVVKKLKNDQKN